MRDDFSAEPARTIGIDGSFLARDDRGMGRAIRSILNCWKSDSEPHRLILLCHKRRHLAGLRDYAQGDWEVCLAAEAPALDVCWFPWSRVDWDSPCPSVVFIHDVVPFTPYHPEQHRKVDQERLRQAADSATLLMTNSQFSSLEIAQHLGREQKDIQVVTLACDPETFSPQVLSTALPKGLEDGGFMLYVGNWEPRKNLKGLLAGLALADVELPLALVCPKPTHSWTDWLLGRHPTLCRQLESLSDRLIWLDKIDDKALVRLYQGTALFVMPSLYEGFGLPLLEAIACGAHTAAARASSLPEVGGQASRWFDPNSPEDIARTLKEALNQEPLDPRIASDQAARFSWKASAQRTLDILLRAACAGRRR